MYLLAQCELWLQLVGNSRCCALRNKSVILNKLEYPVSAIQGQEKYIHIIFSLKHMVWSPSGDTRFIWIYWMNTAQSHIEALTGAKVSRRRSPSSLYFRDQYLKVYLFLLEVMIQCQILQCKAEQSTYYFCNGIYRCKIKNWIMYTTPHTILWIEHFLCILQIHKRRTL